MPRTVRLGGGRRAQAFDLDLVEVKGLKALHALVKALIIVAEAQAKHLAQVLQRRGGSSARGASEGGGRRGVMVAAKSADGAMRLRHTASRGTVGAAGLRRA